MKAVSLVKKEMMEGSAQTYLTWLAVMGFWLWAYFNTPGFIIHADMLNIFVEVLKGAWSLTLTVVTGFVMVIVTKAAGKWWDETGKVWYEKWFTNKNKTDNTNQ